MELLTRQQLEELRQFDTPTICNAIEGFGLRTRTQGYTNPTLRLRVAGEANKPMAGYARTGIISSQFAATSNHNDVMERYYTQYENFDLPQVAVIQDLDPTPIGSFWGDVQATVHQSLGCVGTITSGGVRDMIEVDKLGFYLFSKEVLISHAYIHMVEAGGTVEVCGMTVRGGDLVHADCHGAIVIPHEVAPKLAKACRQAVEAENALLYPCRDAIIAGVKPTAKQIMGWRADMAQARQQIGK